MLRELRENGAPTAVRDWAQALPDWISVREPHGASLVGSLGLEGKRAAIAIAKELGIQLLSDDGPARAAARKLGLPVSGTLGGLQLAHARSLLDITAVLGDLEQTNFHRGEGLLEDVVRGAVALRSLFLSQTERQS